MAAPADDPSVNHHLSAVPSAPPEPGAAGRSPRRRWIGLPSWVWLLSRPLAVDEHRVLFWVRHVRIGVVLTEVSAAIVFVYALLEGRPHAGALLSLAVLVMLGAPVLLLLPMHHWCRDHRGALVFYVWSTATT